jgi:hypothetical protein
VLKNRVGRCGGHDLRIATGLLIAIAVLCGCNPRQERAPAEAVALDSLAHGLNEWWPRPSWDVRMTMFWKQEAGREYLHCRLENTFAHNIALDGSAVTWKTPGLLDFSAITGRGRLVYKNGFLESLIAVPTPVPVAPGQALEGDIDLQYLPIPSTARGEDLLLLWSHGVRIIHGDGNGAVSGVTFLPKRRLP